MNAEIIIVGSKSTNSQFLSHELASYGITTTHLTTAGNDYAGLRESLRHALSQNDMVLMVGGLDVEDNCPVREVVSDVLGAPLEINDEGLGRIQEYYTNTSKIMPVDYEKLAMLPRGCTVFPNDHGYAPGCALTRYGQHVILLPSENSQLMPMFSDYVAPYLSVLINGTIVSRTVGVFGLSEEVLNQRLADLMSEANPGVSSYAKDGEAILRITARASDRRSAWALCDPVVEEIKQRLGVYVYGVDVGSLQKAVVALLLDKRIKIATAESCTAGLLSSRLTEVAGVSAVFECGIAAYSPEIKHSVLGVPDELIERFGTVSPEVAGAMATGARKVGKAALGVGITGVAGPDESEGKPVGTVYIAVADDKRVWAKKITIDAIEGNLDRESIRALATSNALDLVRRYLEAMPTVMAGGEIIEDNAPDTPTIPESRITKEKSSLRCRIFPCKGDRKIDIFIKIAFIFSVLFITSVLLFLIYLRVLKPFENQRLFNQIADIYNDSVIPTDLNINYPDGTLPEFYALYAKNSEVAGWVKIDGTEINYPVMSYKSGFYHNHNFNRQYSKYGVPYFSKNTVLTSSESVNRSMVIYGNNTHDGQMFSELTRYYNDLSYLRDHPVIEMNTLYKSAEWKIFSVMVVAEPNGGSGRFDYTRSTFEDEYDFLGFAGEIRTRSLYNLPMGEVGVQEGDSILLLSTDFEDTAEFEGTRLALVVAARQIRLGESETVDLSGATLNSAAVMPDEWPHRATRTTTPKFTTGTLSTVQTTEATSSDTSVTTSALITSSATSGTSDGSQATTFSTTTATTTSTTTTKPTTSTTESTQPSTVPPIQAGRIAESVFLSSCKIEDDDSKTFTPKNKSELQMVLARVVKTELGSSRCFDNDLAAQKAQAIASYSKILNIKNFSIKGSKTINLNDSVDKKIYDAVGEVVGIKILDGDSPIAAQYFASSPGFTSNNHEVYRLGKNLSYLQSVQSKHETASKMHEAAKWKTEFTISMAELKEKLEAKHGTVYFESGSTPFFVREYDKNGQYVIETNAYYMSGGSKRYLKGHEIRMAVGPTNLRSHAFTVKSSTAESLTLSVTGYGHGIGMSQEGAANYAKYEGWGYRQILSHYYSITKTSKHQLVAPVWGSAAKGVEDTV
ncbi:MAG: CinA family nicotinamide mononucleotide deamidase-related protein [Oscillospiraceae bacterium]|nr:CinA family nicotinamide mononucleotide deamidase-related protein [Oscillospiraceae bacterium]MDD4413074.1 CinA family nicotinamide mononucleotide deamidase-related protein [Oscillospiraceae bacterium]